MPIFPRVLQLLVLVKKTVFYPNSNLIKFYSNQRSTMSGFQLQDVVKKLQEIAPLTLAESWDNVGLLVEPDSNASVTTALLTIDLTEEVVEEAVQLGAQLIISYHPNIFKPLKSLSQSTWKERIIVQCIKHNIAVFSPHTSWDAMANGVNDWLGSALPIVKSEPILLNKDDSKIGMGRLLTIDAISLAKSIELVKQHIGIPHLRLGMGKSKTLDSTIRTVALCAGSGASVLGNLDVDLYLTGEMSHHEVLDATQRGVSVILCNHSDSERGFLKVFQTRFTSEHLTVHVSKIDRDCLTTV